MNNTQVRTDDKAQELNLKDTEAKSKPNWPQKQQNLEISTPNTQDEADQSAKEPQMATGANAVKSATAPQPYSPPAAPEKPTAPKKPAVRKNQTETAVGGESAPRKRQRSESAKAPAPEQPQLVKPPTRTVTPATPTPSLSQGRPVLKRERVQETVDVDKTPAAESVETAKEGATQKPARRTPRVAPSSEQATPKAQPVIELKRPKPARPNEAVAPTAIRPKFAVGTAESQEVEEEPNTVNLLEGAKELRKRPTLASPPKAGKKRQEEDDELQELKAKAGTKVKRQKPLIDIEDEDLLEDGELDLDAAVQVSLAVARPAKPKAARNPVSLPTTASVAAAKSRKPNNSRDRNQQQEAEPKRERPEKLMLTGSLSVQELADALAVQDTEIVRILFVKGMAVNITQNLDIPTITKVANELGVQVETVEPEAEARKVTEMLDAEDLEHLQRRPPVVTIMGHVDHGKTTLLDSIRQTKVAQGEAGGITQHIGAYHVDVEREGQVQQVVFLDTPGHEAFTAMRARGARVTDLAVLVVAADDGVRPQTVEAISHAQAAGVPIVVAINKIDKEGAQPDRVKQELTQYGLTTEEWGGETIMVPVSAIRGENLDTLLEMILLVTEVEELSANPNRAAKGTVIEAHLDKAKGPVATLLIQNGTLHVGDVLVAGSAFGKVRAMVDDRGRRVEAATPSFAVEVLGLSDVPAAGDEFEVFQNEKEARAIATDRADKQRQSRLMQGRVTLATLSAQAQEGELKELNLILKADVQGSVEAIVGSLKQLPQNEVQIRLLLSAPGEITETDIDLAAASNAVIVGFNTTLASGARQAADEAGVDVREYDIIYKLLEDIQGAMEGLLEPELVEEALGQAQVRAVFPVGRGSVAGCYIQSGKVVRNCKVRVRRGGKVIHEGTLDSLKRMKEDVREVSTGYECGIGVDKFNEWAEDDIIEAFHMVTKRRTLSAAK
jgi:translation initiation factor IF-2